METDSGEVQRQTGLLRLRALPPRPPHQAGASQLGLSPHTGGSGRKPPADEMSFTGHDLPHQAGHSKWTETEVGARYGQRGPGDRRKQEPIWSFWSKALVSCLEGTQAVARGLARVRPTQMPAVFFLLGSFPKQTRRGGKMKGGPGGEGNARPGGATQEPPDSPREGSIPCW